MDNVLAVAQQLLSILGSLVVSPLMEMPMIISVQPTTEQRQMLQIPQTGLAHPHPAILQMEHPRLK